MSKLQRARREYRCHCCKGSIGKGEMFARKPSTLGDGTATDAEREKARAAGAIPQTGLRVQARECERCHA